MIKKVEMMIEASRREETIEMIKAEAEMRGDGELLKPPAALWIAPETMARAIRMRHFQQKGQVHKCGQSRTTYNSILSDRQIYCFSLS